VEDQWPALVSARKACRICVQRSPGRIRSGAEFEFDPDVVSHWQQWLGHKQPKLLIVGQDFANVDYFVRYRGMTSRTTRPMTIYSGYLQPPESALKIRRIPTRTRRFSRRIRSCVSKKDG
jgi:hypothetical protein